MPLSLLQELLKLNEEAPKNQHLGAKDGEREIPKLTKKQLELYGGITKANGFTLDAALKMYEPK